MVCSRWRNFTTATQALNTSCSQVNLSKKTYLCSNSLYNVKRFSHCPILSPSGVNSALIYLTKVEGLNPSPGTSFFWLFGHE